MCVVPPGTTPWFKITVLEYYRICTCGNVVFAHQQPSWRHTQEQCPILASYVQSTPYLITEVLVAIAYTEVISITVLWKL